MSTKSHKTIAVVGNFGYANHDLSGQTIKTRFTYELLKKYSQDKIIIFDTQTLKNRMRIFNLFSKVCSCDILVYLPAHGNLKYLFPIYFILSKIFGFQIIYPVIGGWLVPYLKNKPVHRWMLKHIKVVLAETTRMKNDLENDYGFRNVDVMYNFRIIDFKPVVSENEDLRLVYMARVDPQKGLDTIFRFCDYISSLPSQPKITIDFYGQIMESYKSEFERQLNKYSFAKYKGVLEPKDIYEHISGYDMLILPTHYYTEGLPGSLIEAYLSGLPAIVTEWMHSHEFVEDGVTGFVIPFKNNQSEFNESIMKIYSDRKLLKLLKEGAISKSKHFTSEYAWNKIAKYL